MVDRFEYFEDGEVRARRRELRDGAGQLLLASTRRTERDAVGREIRVAIQLDEQAERDLYEVRYDAEGRIDRVAFGGADAPQTWLMPLYDEATHAARGYLDVGLDWELQVDTELDARGLVSRERILYRAGTGEGEVHDRQYRYDDRRFLVGMQSPDGDAAYTYSASGSLRVIEDSRGPREIARAAGRLDAGNLQLLVDASGRLTQRGDLELAYGANGQLELARRGGERIELSHDESDRRVLERRNGAPVAAYLGDALITEDALFEPLRVGGRVVGVVENGVLRRVATDPRGSVLAEEADGYLSLSPYGLRETHPSFAEALDYAAKGYDADLGLVRMGVRDYDPWLGQFTTPDPSFLEDLEVCSRSPVECNLYGYASNDPVGFVDPTGLESVSVPGVGGGVRVK